MRLRHVVGDLVQAPLRGPAPGRAVARLGAAEEVFEVLEGLGHAAADGGRGRQRAIVTPVVVRACAQRRLHLGGHDAHRHRRPSPGVGIWRNGTAPLPPSVYCGSRPSQRARYCCWISTGVSEAATRALYAASASPFSRRASATPRASSRAASPLPLAVAAAISAWRCARISSQRFCSALR